MNGTEYESFAESNRKEKGKVSVFDMQKNLVVNLGIASVYIYVQIALIIAYTLLAIFYAIYGTKNGTLALVTKQELGYVTDLDISIPCQRFLGLLKMQWVVFTSFMTSAIFSGIEIIVIFFETRDWKGGQYTDFLRGFRPVQTLHRAIVLSIVYAITVQQAGSTDIFTQTLVAIMGGAVPEAMWYLQERFRGQTTTGLVFYIFFAIVAWIVIGWIGFDTLKDVGSHANRYSPMIVGISFLFFILVVTAHWLDLLFTKSSEGNAILDLKSTYMMAAFMLTSTTTIYWLLYYELAFVTPRVIPAIC